MDYERATMLTEQQRIDNQMQKNYNAKEVGEILGYILQSMGYSFQPVNLENGIAQANQRPLATSQRMTMTVKDVAHELSTSTQTVRAMINRGELPAFKVGRTFAISRTEFEKWVMQQGQVQKEKIVKRANGEGSYRYIKEKKLYQGRITIDGHAYTRYGKTHDEVRRKIMNLRTSADAGCLPEPTKMTVEEWLLIWLDTYCMVKASSRVKYESVMKNHIFPAIGDLPLQRLNTQRVQRLYNQKHREGKSPKTIKDIHGILHKPLEKAVQLGYLQRNVCNGCELPRAEQKEMRPIKDQEVSLFLNAIKGTRYEHLLYVAVFTGMRQGELLGLTWDCIDFERGIIRIYRQLQPIKRTGDEYVFSSLKSRASRIIEPAAAVMDTLRAVQAQQQIWKDTCGEIWDNPDGLVFTNELGKHLCHFTVYKHFKQIVESIGLKQIRFHDMRHTFAVLSLETGADMKTVSATMGHATVSFTMQAYGHVSNAMRRENAQRMQRYIENLD